MYAAARSIIKNRCWSVSSTRRIRDGDKRVGTLAVATSILGSRTLRLSSLYVRPAERGHGHAKRALSEAYAAATEAGLSGIRFSTEWSWQAAVRFYLGLGAWVWGWKRSLDFVMRKELPPRFEAWDRKHGWQTPAPRIPGLEYPDWDAL